MPRLSEYLFSDLSTLKNLSRSDDRYKCRVEDSRRIEEPPEDLKQVQRRISNLLLRIEPPAYLHTPAKKRSPITNAREHLDCQVIVSLDIKQYFPSIRRRKVFDFFFKTMRCSCKVSNLLADLCVFKGRLPTGSPSSGIIAYFSLIEMWEEIHNLTLSNECIFTLYADDLTISGKQIPKDLVSNVKKIIRSYELRLNDKKEKHRRSPSPCEVTGNVIKDGVLKAPNRKHKKRHELHNAMRSKSCSVEEREKLLESHRGIDSYIKSIEGQ